MSKTEEEYSKKYQGGLFYPSDPISDRKIVPTLFRSYYETKYHLTYGDKNIAVSNMTKELVEYLKEDGWEIERKQTKRYYGKKKLFGMDVKIKKEKLKGEDGISIKIIGNNRDSISKKLEKIKEGLSEHGIKPKICIKQRPDLEETIDDSENGDNDTTSEE